jgi:hypothetical protein
MENINISKCFLNVNKWVKINVNNNLFRLCFNIATLYYTLTLTCRPTVYNVNKNNIIELIF